MDEGEMWKNIAEYPRNRIIPEQAARRSVSVDGHKFDIFFEKVSMFGHALKVVLSGSEQSIQFAVCYDGEVVSRETLFLFSDPRGIRISGGQYHNFLVQEDGVRTHYMVKMIGSPEAPGFEITRNQKEIVAIIPERRSGGL